jgi:hypothetical protein
MASDPPEATKPAEEDVPIITPERARELVREGRTLRARTGNASR